MNVLIVSRLYPRPTDPILGVFVEEEARALAQQCSLRVVSPVPWFPPVKLSPRWYDYSQLPLREVRQGIEVYRPRTVVLPRNILFPLLGFSFYLSLRRLIREIEGEFPVDLVHAHMAYPDGFAAAKLGKAMGRPTVVTLHGGDVTLYFRSLFGRRLGLWAITNADSVIAVSNSLRSKVIEEDATLADKITVIPNGVDVSRFAPLPRSQARSQLGLSDETARVLYVGAITRSKGLDYLLTAFKTLVANTREPVELVLVGEGEYEHDARLLARRLDLADHVFFVGKRPNAEILLWMNASDLVVLPSLNEGFGVVLIEAMACGKPVVATRSGGPEDIVTPHTGILVPRADEKALAGAMLEALGDGERFSPAVIRQHAVDNYAFEDIAARLLDVYAEALHP